MSLFTQTRFDALVQKQKGTTLVDQWEARVAKVGGKVFALLGPNSGDPRITFKCGEDSFAILTEIEGIAQAPYFAKRQWVSVSRSADLSDAELKAYIERSHALIAKGLTRKARAELGIMEPEA